MGDLRRQFGMGILGTMFGAATLGGCAGAVEDQSVPPRADAGTAVQDAGARDAAPELGFRAPGSAAAIAVDAGGRAMVTYSEAVPGMNVAFTLKATTYEPGVGWSTPVELGGPLEATRQVSLSAAPGGFVAVYSSLESSGMARLALRRWVAGVWQPEVTLHALPAPAGFHGAARVGWSDEHRGLVLWVESDSTRGYDYTQGVWSIGHTLLEDGAIGPIRLLRLPLGEYAGARGMARGAAGWVGSFEVSSGFDRRLGSVPCDAEAGCFTDPARYPSTPTLGPTVHGAGSAALLVRRDGGTERWSIVEQTPDSVTTSEVLLGVVESDAYWEHLAANASGERLLAGRRRGFDCGDSLLVSQGTAGSDLRTRAFAHPAGFGLGELQLVLAESGHRALVWSEGTQPSYSECFGSDLYFQRGDQIGSVWRERLATTPRTQISNLKAAISESGRVLVAYEEHETPMITSAAPHVVVTWVDASSSR